MKYTYAYMCACFYCIIKSYNLNAEFMFPINAEINYELLN